MSSSGRRRFHVRRHPVVVHIGSSCRILKLISLFNFSLISRSWKSGNNIKSMRSRTFDSFPPPTSLVTTITNSSLFNNDTSSPPPPSLPSYVASPKKKKTKRRRKKKTKRRTKKILLEEEKVRVVEIYSYDLYRDFKDLMLQMIVREEIYKCEKLEELLYSFLSLNSPDHYSVIIKAFTNIWNGISSGEQQ